MGVRNMRRIGLSAAKSVGNLYGRSKWWGFPDLPESLDWPTVPVEEDGETYDDPLTFLCQIRCADLKPFDPAGLLPHRGMLYFFAALDYYLGNLDAAVSPGMGEWSRGEFQVLYSPTTEGLNTHSLLYEDGSSACLPAEKMVFGVKDSYTGLLGEPYLEEVREAMPGLVSLLQVDENDEWGLRFFDSGMFHFLIAPDSLAARRWQDVRCFLHSF